MPTKIRLVPWIIRYVLPDAIVAERLEIGKRSSYDEVGIKQLASVAGHATTLGLLNSTFECAWGANRFAAIAGTANIDRDISITILIEPSIDPLSRLFRRVGIVESNLRHRLDAVRGLCVLYNAKFCCKHN